MNYRLYSFVNFYLSSIQQGVQTAHLVSELFAETTDKKKLKVLKDWAKNDKTIIILNGGANADILETFDKLTLINDTLSWSAPIGRFKEDKDSLGGLTTCCGIVVPESVWGAVDYRTAIREEYFLTEDSYPIDGFFFQTRSSVTTYNVGTAEHDLITVIKSCGLAR